MTCITLRCDNYKTLKLQIEKLARKYFGFVGVGMFRFLTSKFCSILVILLQLAVVVGLGYIFFQISINIFTEQVGGIVRFIAFIVAIVVVGFVIYLCIKFLPNICLVFVPLKPLFVVLLLMATFQGFAATWDSDGLPALQAILSDWRFLALIAVYIILVCASCILINFARNKLIDKYLPSSDQ